MSTAVGTLSADDVRMTQPTKGAGTLRRAVRGQAFARILGGRHMECAYYFDFGRLCQGWARANAYLRIIESIIRKDCDSICNASTMVAFGDSNSNPVFGICGATLSTTANG